MEEEEQLKWHMEAVVKSIEGDKAHLESTPSDGIESSNPPHSEEEAYVGHTRNFASPSSELTHDNYIDCDGKSQFFQGRSNVLDESSPSEKYSIGDAQYLPAGNVNLHYDETTKMYECHLCDFRTPFRNSVLNHQAVHSDLRPWVCAVCEYAAKRKQDLKKHLHTVHGMMVESTQLKPIGIPNTIIPSTGPSNVKNESVNYWDGGKVGKQSDFYLPPVSMSSSGDFRNMTQRQPHDLGTEAFAADSKAGKVSTFNSEFGSTPEDDDLPVSFPGVSALQCKVEPGLASSEPPLSPGEIRPDSFHFNTSGGNVYNHLPEKTPLSIIQGTQEAKRFHANFFQSHPSPTDFMRRSGIKRPRESSTDRFPPFNEKINRHSHQPAPTSSMPLLVQCNKPSTKAELEDPNSCSSSTNVSHGRESQTRQSFLCQHCDIMFFQRAMYLMHAGLHSPENPWCCTVCNNTFTEKYSFTSHFINQH